MFARACATVVVLAFLIPAGQGLPPTAAPVTYMSDEPMQGDDANPLWETLRATGRGPAEWAQLMVGDADGNAQSDFLDVLTVQATATGGLTTSVELLVRGEGAALQALMGSFEDAVLIEAGPALFVTVRLADVERLHVPGVSQIVWEPRVQATDSQNPAGGSPSTMPQISISEGGAAWSGSPSYTGSGVTIAILDTGADAGHQALDGGKVSKWKDCTSTAASAYDDHGHGTHVASIAAGDDGTDFRGMAYQASVNAVKILDAAGSGTLADFQCGITWVASGGAAGAKTADVASMSAGLSVPPLGITTLNGGPIDYFLWDGVAAQLYAEDIPFSVAAGNWVGTAVEVIGLDETTHAGVNGVNQVSSPGYSNKVITVGAVDLYRAPATFTALGPGATVYKPDVAAMGVDTWGALEGQTSWYGQWDGTSMATPLVGGALAMLYQKDSTETAAGYYVAIRNGAEQGCIVSSTATTCTVGEMPDPNMVMGHGVLNVPNSLALI